MPLTTDLSKRLQLDIPLIVAPLAGGPTTPALVAASSEAGALGSLGAAYLTPEKITADIEAVRRATKRPFAVNLFTPMPRLALAPERVAAANAATRAYRDELGLSEPVLSPPFHPDFDSQLEAVVRARPAVFSFVFGLVPAEALAACRKAGILTMGTATTVEEGRELEASGVDAIVAQGVEAGGHRGIFDPLAPDPGIATLALTRALASRVRVPVVAAGGIMDGAGIARALAAGAQAAQMGTAFLVSDEAGTSAPYREALSRGPRETALTRAFSGRWARGLRNRFLDETEARPEAVLPFPAQNAFTRDLRAKSAALGSPDFLSLWAGTGVGAIRPGLSAKKIIDALRAELAREA